jgi:hypothetical protein
MLERNSHVEPSAAFIPESLHDGLEIRYLGAESRIGKVVAHLTRELGVYDRRLAVRDRITYYGVPVCHVILAGQ